jgi:Alpha/beta hydrolase of unknown function (DUF900)
MNYILDFRGADVGGPVIPGRIIRVDGVPLGTEDDLRQEPKITFLLHGFNVNRQDGTDGLLRLGARLPAASDGAIVAVLWPGDHWVRAISYPFEGNDADDSAAEMARFIDRVVRPGTSLFFVSHSLGARVVMGTVQRLTSGRYAIRQICLMAAAINDFSLSNPDNYRAVVTATVRVAVLASHEDLVLRLAYPVGDVLQAFLFWKDEAGLALGYHGPRPSDENLIPDQVYYVQIPDGRDSGHGDYIPSDPPSPNQVSAAQFADEVIRGMSRPQYT